MPWQRVGAVNVAVSEVQDKLEKVLQGMRRETNPR
jgi:hypothetical protein